MEPESCQDLIEGREVLQVGVILKNIELHLYIKYNGDYVYLQGDSG